MQADAPPLEVRDLVKRYGAAAAVDGVSFTVPRGHVFCLLGPNGAGKTTTLSIAQGVRRPTSGTVRLFGEDPIRASRALKRRIGVLPQTFAAFEVLTVRENVQYVADIFDADPDIPRLLEGLGLTEYADRRFHGLSGGTRRRVGIVTALVNDPELVFLDEPTAGVDPASRRQLWEIIRNLKKEGRSVVLTTHYMDEAERLADDVAIIEKGRIIAQGPPERVRLQHGGHTVLKLVGLAGELPPSIAQRPGVARGEDGSVLIPLTGASEGPAVVADLVKSGVAFHELSIREPTLDDAFVRLVAKKGA